MQNIQPDEPTADIAAAMMIDMEPLPTPVVAQPVKEEVPVEPEPVKPEPVQQEAAPEPVEQVQPDPEQQIQPLEEVTPDLPEPDLAEEVTPEPEEAEPVDEQAEELVELPKVDVPLPVVRPQARKPDTPKNRIVEQSVRKPVKKTETADLKDETPREAKRQPTFSRSTSRGEQENWNSRVRAHIARYAQRARVRGQGKSVGLVVVVSERGDIVSVGLASASGDQELDQSVRQAVSRAPATPTPPSGLSSAERRFAVTIRVR